MPIIGILLLAIGAALAFGGYKLQILFRFIPGLWAGALIGAATVGVLYEPRIGLLIGAVLFGLAGAAVSNASEKAGLFLEFFVFGYVLALGYLSYTSSLLVAVPVAVICGVITGMLSRFASRIWIISATSLAGGLAGGSGLGLLTGNPLVGVIAIAIIIIAGICVQLNITSKSEKPNKIQF